MAFEPWQQMENLSRPVWRGGIFPIFFFSVGCERERGKLFCFANLRCETFGCSSLNPSGSPNLVFLPNDVRRHVRVGAPSQEKTLCGRKKKCSPGWVNQRTFWYCVNVSMAFVPYITMYYTKMMNYRRVFVRLMFGSTTCQSCFGPVLRTWLTQWWCLQIG